LINTDAIGLVYIKLLIFHCYSLYYKSWMWTTPGLGLCTKTPTLCRW